MSSISIEQIKEEVVTASRILIDRGICEAFGHESARLTGMGTLQENEPGERGE